MDQVKFGEDNLGLPIVGSHLIQMIASFSKKV